MLPHSIIAEKFSRLREGAAVLCRRIRVTCRRRHFTRGQIAVAAIVAALPLSAALATLTVSTSPETEQAPSAAPAAAVAPAAPRDASLIINNAETASSLMARLGINDPELEKFIYSNPDAAVFAYPRRGQFALARVAGNGQVISLSMYVEGARNRNIKTTITRDAKGLTVASAPFKFDSHNSMAAIRVGRSFAAEAREAGVPSDIIADANRVEYRNSPLLRKAGRGDTVSLIYENRFIDGHLVSTGRLLGIELQHGKEVTPLYWFEDGTKGGGYYYANGETTEQTFRRYPLNSFRISSPFTTSRRNPVTGRVRAHEGVDLAAPRGTPVYSVSDGIIEAADSSLSGYGNRIDINHVNGYSTRYGHLKGYAKGIRPGVFVKKGQLIGYCGSTGVSTGPHVHFEFHVNGRPVNPVKVAIQTNARIPSRYYAAARPRVTALARQMKQLDAVQTASNGKTVPVMSADQVKAALAAADTPASKKKQQG